MAGRIPSWLKSDLPGGQSLKKVAAVVSSMKLNTICFEARCPNKAECFKGGSITFLILGRNCSRHCGFCNVVAALPERLDGGEPERVKQACSLLGLDYVILTSVTRDDLPDGGSDHFAKCVRLIKEDGDSPTVEVLIPDFGGSLESVERVASAGVDVLGHNLETVERLYTTVRDEAGYGRSLGILDHVKSRFPGLVVKSGLMLGLGEESEEVKSTLKDLADAGCDIVVVGQYMRPSMTHLPVQEYIDPAVFDELKDYARELGLVGVCGPKARSSYLAKAAYNAARLRRQKRCA
ncbi:MAG: lipoyl synthase [Candidatus Eisenbacteria bacterium]